MNVGGRRRVCAAGLSTGLVGAVFSGRNNKSSMNQNPAPMSQTIHFLGLDVHKESVSVSIAPGDSTEVRHYGQIGGALDDMDRLIKKLQGAAPAREERRKSKRQGRGGQPRASSTGGFNPGWKGRSAR